MCRHQALVAGAPRTSFKKQGDITVLNNLPFKKESRVRRKQPKGGGDERDAMKSKGKALPVAAGLTGLVDFLPAAFFILFLFLFLFFFLSPQGERKEQGKEGSKSKGRKALLSPLCPIGHTFLPTPKWSPAFLHITISTTKLSHEHTSLPHQARPTSKAWPRARVVLLALLFCSLALIGRTFLPTVKRSPHHH